MKKRTVVLSVFLLFALQMFSALTAKPQSNAAPQHNGSHWNNLSADGRLWFVVGYSMGLNDGLILPASAKLGADGKAVPPQTAMDTLLLHNVTRIVGSKPPSYGELSDEMNSFYRDFRNTPVCWDGAEQIAILTLTGAAPSDSDLDALRSEDAKDGCQ